MPLHPIADKAEVSVDFPYVAGPLLARCFAVL